MRAAETLLWVVGAIAAAMTLAAILAALTARGSNGKRPTPPEPPVTEDDIDRWIADWDPDK